ncbi:MULTISPECIES: hypothetical protein [unclassified Marinovum]
MFNNGQTSARRSHAWAITQFRLTNYFRMRTMNPAMACLAGAADEEGDAANGLSREDLTTLFADDLQRENRVAVTRARKLPQA